jgi:multicomponent Na+:H+ antiporter subunit A
MIPLQAVAIALVALAGVAVVLTRDLLRLALVFGFYGLTLVVLFVVYQAPDVALSVLVVSTVPYPLLILLALAKVHRSERRRG